MNVPRISSGVVFALASAVLFGLSTPLAKILVGDVNPWLLAGLLYLGSGLGLAITYGVMRLTRNARGEASLRRADLPWLAGVVFFGGLAGPVLLMLGLSQTQSSTAALLLNLEGLFTLVIAWVVFRENTDLRIITGAIAILAGAVLLSWQGGAIAIHWSTLAIAGACLCWGIDNNLTRKLSIADPIQITIIKGLVAGSVNFVLAQTQGATIPGVNLLAGSAVVGFFGYGLSLVLFVLALRSVGSARTGAYFALAPFIGASASVIFLHDAVTVRLIIAGLFMAAGLYLHLTERHEHKHVHDEIDHEHRHKHDEHHQHEHLPGDPPGEPHSHPHRHPTMVHSHPHYPDLHHLHPHG